MLHLVICNAHSLVDAFGGSSLSEMVRNRILECPTCFKQVRSDLLKSHCKSKHGMSDDQIKLMKTYPCRYCKKNFSRSVNCRYHELHCKPRKPDDISYRHDFQFGSGNERNGDFEEIEQGLNRLMVAYRKKLTHENNFDKLQLAFSDAITVLQKEVAVRFGIKWYFALKLTFRKAIDDDVVTDPPVVLNTDPVMGLISNNYENDLDKIFQKILQQIDGFETNGSGWITDKFLTLDLRIVTRTPWKS